MRDALSRYGDTGGMLALPWVIIRWCCGILTTGESASFWIAGFGGFHLEDAGCSEYTMEGEGCGATGGVPARPARPGPAWGKGDISWRGGRPSLFHAAALFSGIRGYSRIPQGLDANHELWYRPLPTEEEHRYKNSAGDMQRLQLFKCPRARRKFAAVKVTRWCARIRETECDSVPQIKNSIWNAAGIFCLLHALWKAICWHIQCSNSVWHCTLPWCTFMTERPLMLGLICNPSSHWFVMWIQLGLWPFKTTYFLVLIYSCDKLTCGVGGGKVLLLYCDFCPVTWTQPGTCPSHVRSPGRKKEAEVATEACWLEQKTFKAASS